MFTKKEVLKEIQKWAKENGGKTPSEKILREEMGIPKWDWINYWTKITDVQRDAGLIPHKFDKTKYTKKDLCEMFIKLIREKGKWPTRDELDFKRHHDPRFPASATFYKMLGLIKNLALPKTILEFVNDKQGYDDVVKICGQVLEKYKSIDEQEGESTEKVIHGWVYLFKHGHYNHYRVGETSDLLRRGSEIRIQLPERATLVHSIETVDPEGVETYWLNRFKPKRMNGDWFNLSRTDVNEFKRWKRIV